MVDDGDQDDVTDEGEHKIYASDLVAALGVSEEVAEEMIYIAALQETAAECSNFLLLAAYLPTRDASHIPACIDCMIA